MALKLLNGTCASISVAVNSITGCTSTTSVTNVLSGMFGYMSWDFMNRKFDQSVFLGGTYVKEVPGQRQAMIRLDGFMSSGSTLSSSATLYEAESFNVTAQFDTGCSVTADCVVGRDHEGIRTLGNSERTIDATTTGAITYVWGTT